MTDQEVKDLVANLAVSQERRNVELDKQMKETDKQMKETDKQMKETDRKLKSVGIQLGNIGNNQGDVAEEYFVNSLGKTFSIGDFKFDSITPNLERRKGKYHDEFDIVLVNDNALAIVEVKYKVHPNIVEDLVGKKVKNFKKLFPEYKEYDIYAGIAGFSFPKETVKKAEEAGLFILQRRGRVMKTNTRNMRVIKSKRKGLLSFFA